MTDYDIDIAARSYSRRSRDEAAMALSAMDCILNGAKGVYASSELTTGARAYAMMSEAGVVSLANLTDSLRSAILASNIESARAFAARLREGLRGTPVVITPAPFFAPGWSQAEYLGFWEELIRTRVEAVYFNDRWEFSNGCTFEFAVAVEQGVPTFAADGRPLSSNDGAERIERAADDLDARGIDPSRLRLNLEGVFTSMRSL